MTRFFHLEKPAKDRFILRIGFSQGDVHYGIIEVFYTASDIHHIEYCQPFIGSTLFPSQLTYELTRAVTCVSRLRAGGTLKDLVNGSDELLDYTRFDLQEDF